MGVITIFALVCALLAAFTLFGGIRSMAHGGTEDQRRSNALMFRRVGWQALALLFVFMGMLSQLR